MKIDEFMSASMKQALTPSNPFALAKGVSRAPTNTLNMKVENIPSDWIRTNVGQRKYLLLNLYMLAYMTSEVRSVIQIIRNEVFRRGLKGWVPKFNKKCIECGDTTSTGDTCRLCGGKLRGPDPKQYQYADQLFKRCNKHGQTLEEVLKQFHDDLNIADDAFLLLNKEYKVNDNGEIVGRTVELYRLHPGLVEFDLSTSGEIKASHYTCRIHRNFYDEEGSCPECGAPLWPVLFLYQQQKEKLPLIDDEIIHAQKFSPGILYGLSPLLSLFEKTLTIVGMDKYLYRYFFERKMPSSVLITTTDDTEGLRREREYLEMKLQEDPDYIPWLGVSARTGKGSTDLIRLYHTLQEMDYLPIRSEIRERISAFYGVTPVWENVPEQSGGLTGQSMALIVTSRVVESDQRIYHTKVFPELLEEGFGITDWSLVLNQPEEKAESTRIQFTQQRVASASVLQNMGFKVEIIGEKANLDDVQFEVSNVEEKEKAEGYSGFPGKEEESKEGEEGEKATRGEMPQHSPGDLHRHASRNYPHLRSEQHSDNRNVRGESSVTKPVEGVRSNVYPGESGSPGET